MRSSPWTGRGTGRFPGGHPDLLVFPGRRTSPPLPCRPFGAAPGPPRSSIESIRHRSDSGLVGRTRMPMGRTGSESTSGNPVAAVVMGRPRALSAGTPTPARCCRGDEWRARGSRSSGAWRTECKDSTRPCSGAWTWSRSSGGWGTECKDSTRPCSGAWTWSRSSGGWGTECKDSTRPCSGAWTWSRSSGGWGTECKDSTRPCGPHGPG